MYFRSIGFLSYCFSVVVDVVVVVAVGHNVFECLTPNSLHMPLPTIQRIKQDTKLAKVVLIVIKIQSNHSDWSTIHIYLSINSFIHSVQNFYLFFLVLF